ncbi:MAG TPA: hypothetical protein VFU05_19280, partial [Cyclobacteriaceae bacterium]|nr:hypothetical protein [Cyclobacteriaceae bacterium]
GFIFALVDVWFEKQFKNVPLFYSITIKTLSNLFVALSLTIVLMPAIAVVTPVGGIPVLTDLLFTSNVVIVGVYMLFMTTLIQLAKQVSSWLDS